MPVGLRRLLTEHDVAHVARLGWQGVSNGELIRRAEREGYEVMVTADRNLRYQQNMTDRQIALVVLSTSKWATVRAHLEHIREAVDQAQAGTFRTVDLGRRV